MGHSRLGSFFQKNAQRWARFGRRGLRRLGHAPYQVVYHRAYSKGFADLPMDPLRADQILAYLASEGFVSRLSLHRPEAVWMKALAAVHTAEYLDSIHNTEVLGRILGSSILATQVDQLIDYQRLQTGGTLMATRRARGRGVGVHLGGGFHHAHANHGGGFCIFNDVATAIADERRRGFRGRVLIIDLDLHDGDGNRSIFAEDPQVHTFSIHARHWAPTEAIESTSLALGEQVDDTTYLACLEDHLPDLYRRFRPHLVFYLAGTDVAAGDRLGSWQLSAEALLRRDQRVFRLCRGPARPVPMVILLAGGYGHDSWRYSARFLANRQTGKALFEPPSSDEITFKRYRYISRLIDYRQLSGGTVLDPPTDDDFGLTTEDLYLPGWGAMQPTRFLGFYTKTGIELILERSGFLDRLRHKGFAHPTLELQLNDPAGETLRLLAGPESDDVLVELRLLRDRKTWTPFDLLSVEWLMMQNPRASFEPPQRPLPGQERPGLGLLSDVIALLRLACERIHADGLVFVPSTYLVAAYGGERPFRFLGAEDQARFAALNELFVETSLGDATLALAEGRVRGLDGEVYAWQPEPMLLPVNRRLHLALKAKHRDDPATGTYRFHLASRASKSGSVASSG